MTQINKTAKRKATEELPRTRSRKRIKLTDSDYNDEIGDEEEIDEEIDDEEIGDDESEEEIFTQINPYEMDILSDDESEPHEDMYRELFEEEYAKIDEEKRIMFWKSITKQAKDLHTGKIDLDHNIN